MIIISVYWWGRSAHSYRTDTAIDWINNSVEDYSRSRYICVDQTCGVWTGYAATDWNSNINDWSIHLLGILVV